MRACAPSWRNATLGSALPPPSEPMHGGSTRDRNEPAPAVVRTTCRRTRPHQPERVRRKDVSDVAEERYRGASVRRSRGRTSNTRPAGPAPTRRARRSSLVTTSGSTAGNTSPFTRTSPEASASPATKLPDPTNPNRRPIEALPSRGGPRCVRTGGPSPPPDDVRRPLASRLIERLPCNVPLCGHA